MACGIPSHFKKKVNSSFKSFESAYQPDLTAVFHTEMFDALKMFPPAAKTFIHLLSI